MLQMPQKNWFKSFVFTQMNLAEDCQLGEFQPRFKPNKTLSDGWFRFYLVVSWRFYWSTALIFAGEITFKTISWFGDKKFLITYLLPLQTRSWHSKWALSEVFPRRTHHFLHQDNDWWSRVIMEVAISFVTDISFNFAIPGSTYTSAFWRIASEWLNW